MSLLSGNALSITIGIAGIVASVLCSWFFYWLGGRITRRQNGALLKEINDVRKMLAGYVQSMSERLNLGNQAQEEAVKPPSAAAEPVGELGNAAPNAAVEELVRASLGALVNERGDVDMSRLIREISLATGQQSPASVLDVLRRLRAKGVVEWDGSDESLSDVPTIHVQSLRAGQEMWPTINRAGTVGTDWVSAP